MVNILYNPLANNGQGERIREELSAVLKRNPDIIGISTEGSSDEKEKNNGIRFIDITLVGDISNVLDSFDSGDVVIIAGGDGTLNKFLNNTYGKNYRQKLFFYSAGSGNDFLHDYQLSTGKIVGSEKQPEDKIVPLESLVENLPIVSVNGINKHFINGIGFGIDGYCCEVGDKIRAVSNKPVNYAGIAIKGLLFHFRPTDAVITVDGVAKQYKKVWLAPVMKGRYYGGGMQIAPAQNRMNNEKTVSSVVMFGSGKLKTLVVFPSIFKGAHVKHTEMIDIRTGHEITFEFNRPVALQIDGETILNVTKYSVSSK